MQDDFDFTKPPTTPAASAATAPGPSAPARPAASKYYDGAIARKLFETFGTPETVAAGAPFFAEHDKAAKGLFSKTNTSRMYYLSGGEVTLSMAGGTLDTIRAGEVFGEMAVITGGPRTASAIAKTDCTAYSLDPLQFQAAIQKMPAFALMLMSVMFDRLRLVAARLAARKVAAGGATAREAAVFSAEVLAQLEGALQHAARVRFDAGKAIMREGEAGVCMYVVVAGLVAIVIRDKVVETIGPGGTFGEMALVDQSPRTASAGASTDCELLSINRAALLDVIRAQPVVASTMLRSVAERLSHMNSLLA